MFNIKNMMKQAQEMQSRLKIVTEQLQAMIIEGQSGSGMVKATVTGKGDLKSLSIDHKLVNPDEVEVLEDLIIAAINDAKSKADAISAEKMSAITGGMNLPI